MKTNMDILTLDYVKEKNMTPIDCVKFFRPSWSDKECDIYLWESTCFPFSNEIMIDQLNEQLGEK